MGSDEATKGCQLSDLRKEMALKNASSLLRGDPNLHNARYRTSLSRTSGGILRHYLPSHYEN